MINVYILYNQKTITNITKIVKTAVISGDTSQCSRKLELDIVFSAYDNNIPTTQIGCSTLVWVNDDLEGEIFRGVIFDREVSSDDNHIKITAYDYLVYFLKSKASFNFQNMTPEDIAVNVCREVGVIPLFIAKTGIRINLIAQGEALYDIIMKAYTQVSKINGKQYIPMMNGMLLDIIEKGSVIADFVLDTKKNIISSTYNDSIDNMINRVKIYDKDGNYIGVVNSGYTDSCGILQGVYTVEDGKEPYTVANNMLHGVDNYFKIDILGDIRCKTGSAVKVIIPWLDYTKNGVAMYIDADTHTWDLASGIFKSELTLNFSNKMDLKEA